MPTCVQVDEANVTGHPEDGPIAAAGINRVLEGVRRREGRPPVLRQLRRADDSEGHATNACWSFSTSCSATTWCWRSPGAARTSWHLLNDVQAEIGLGIGVIDIKDNEVESPDTVAARIERAAKTLGAERIRYVHPDCGFWMLPRSSADAKMRALVAGRDLFEGR